MVELVGGGSDINRATSSSFSVSVLLLASVERFGVSRMRDFCLKDRREKEGGGLEQKISKLNYL